MDNLLKSFPRLRPPLPEGHRRVYEAEYKLNREGGKVVEGLAKRLEAWMHRQVAKKRGGPTLELGAGTLNHLQFEANLDHYDVVEPFTALYEDSPRLQSVGKMYADIANVSDDTRYARIVSIAVLEHLENLPADLARSCLLLKKGGLFQAGIPSEGGFLWWLGWRCTTGVSYWIRNRLDYGVMMRHEHLNTAPEIIAATKVFFKNVKVKRFPLPFHHFSLYVYIEACEPRLDVARDVLKVSAVSNRDTSQT